MRRACGEVAPAAAASLGRGRPRLTREAGAVRVATVGPGSCRLTRRTGAGARLAMARRKVSRSPVSGLVSAVADRPSDAGGKAA